jgi:hypothetical protein
VRWFLICLLSGCAPPETSAGFACEPRLESAKVDRVVLVTLDGVRWQDVAERRLPALTRLAEDGIGLVEEIRTSAPLPVSLPGYREILTGRRGRSCIDNLCPPIDEPTLFDELAEIVPREKLALVSSWEGLALAAARDSAALALSTGRHGGSTRELLRVSDRAGEILDVAAERRDFTVHADYRRDADTMALALEILVAARPRLLHVALGDTDEHAHGHNRAGYLAALREDDAFVARVRETLAALGGESVVLVTADHGRADNFSDHGGVGDGSDRVWLIAAGGPIPRRGFVRPSGARRLADVAPSLRELFGLPADQSPRAGSALPELKADEFRMASNHRASSFRP